MSAAYCFLYFLTHEYSVRTDSSGTPIKEIKELGVFSSRSRAEAAIASYSSLPGFIDHPHDYYISRRRCYMHQGETKQTLRHAYMPCMEEYNEREDYDSYTWGSFYSDEQSAQEILATWKKDWQAGVSKEWMIYHFEINTIPLFWAEGFDHAEA